MAKPPATSRAAYWAEVIREYRRSGLTQGQFCREQGVSCHSLRWWLRRLGTQVPADPPRRRRPKSAPPKRLEPEAPRFVPLRVIESGVGRQSDDPSRDASSSIQVLLPSGRRIAVGVDLDPETLRRVVVALEAPGC